VTDGPFIESKELIGGFATIEAGSKEEAIEMGKAFMKIHLDVLGPAYEGELRFGRCSMRSVKTKRSLCSALAPELKIHLTRNLRSLGMSDVFPVGSN
jgi:hypothetical protein